MAAALRMPGSLSDLRVFTHAQIAAKSNVCMAGDVRCCCAQPSPMFAVGVRVRASCVSPKSIRPARAPHPHTPLSRVLERRQLCQRLHICCSCDGGRAWGTAGWFGLVSRSACCLNIRPYAAARVASVLPCGQCLFVGGHVQQETVSMRPEARPFGRC